MMIELLLLTTHQCVHPPAALCTSNIVQHPALVFHLLNRHQQILM
jgi:hypothetical protein